MKFPFSKSATALTLAVLATSSAQLVQAEEVTTPASQPTVTNETVPAPAPTEGTGGDTSQPVLTAEPITTTTTEVAPPVEGQTVDVRILSTTDLHTNLVNYDYYQDKESQNLGLAKTAVLIEEARAENPNTVTVDNGDLIQGTPLGTYKAIVDPVETGEKHPMYAALEELDFDASTLGNHEFNYGLDFLHTVLASTSLPVVNANVVDAKSLQPVFKTYELVTKTFTDTTGRPVNLNIGITGIVPPQILNWDKANLEGKVVVNDAVQAVKEIVPVIKQAGADIVLVLSHSGIGDDTYEVGEENVGYHIAGIDGVDAVVTGHSHALFPTMNPEKPGFYAQYAGVDDVNGTINGTPVTMAGKYGDHLGIIDLKVTYTDGKWNVVDGKGQIRKIDTKSPVADPEILALAKEAHDATVTYVNEKVGETSSRIHSYFSLVKDDPSVQIVNKAQLWYLEKELAGTEEGKLPLLSAAAPFKAGGRGISEGDNYTDIPAGSIAIKNVADLYLYDNVTAILKITGADLKEWLEMSAGQFNQVDRNNKKPQELLNINFRNYNFDVIDGVTYTYDITQPNKYDTSGKLVNKDASRVRDLKYNGQPVTDDMEFMVATNNYRASGTFPGVKNATVNRLLNLENRQVIINYILEEKNINPSADSNWRFADTIKGLDLRFRTSNSAKDLIAAEKLEDVEYIEEFVGDGVNGMGVYRFLYTEPKPESATPPTIDIIIPTPQTPNPKPQKPIKPGQANAGGQVITLSSGQKITLPADKPVETTPAPGVKTLPNTGDATSVLSLIGIGLAGLAGLAAKRRED
ncbi:bifunctional 2',3'-cyclic-nucleotide 2'-phosphodiesterase/3'-nucleotidase [Streptococcus suis]|nr:bifunctional 2',3'-cyclic-nucleotide 2'-phosphodiesterase/3'-nucleotidase [Streptococcus suis]NQL66865.1 bifunctional 2',3'-cyclic-nucleotide 2'-phosphodiesterase/3'-nucleotidase [Streptococcus suis]NQM38095.1 bifunctional 2',3'-cyclic-nucleotide 2'-phosphodiesterase/3'-nucleotidase [Streptococcus suis]UUM62946.1 bifunctional 2',3'-cyclic-nucleotide 2'-phosphodiesterase/3'-nucleotidase [Streptococcus suis]